MKKYYTSFWGKVVEDLNSDIHKGLSEEECNLRRA